MFNQFVEKLSAHLGFEEPLKKNEKGEYLLSLEGDLEILLRENPAPGITLITTLAAMPEKKLAEYLVYTMSANLFGKETGGGILGCDREGKVLRFLRFLPVEISYGDFLAAVEDFTNYAESWRQECIEFTSG
jgi:hypothetical protein